MTPPTRTPAQIWELAKRAREVSDAMSQHGKWTMRVPAWPDDSDVVIYALAEAADQLADLLASRAAEPPVCTCATIYEWHFPDCALASHAAEPPQWQSIETAPKDGTPILVWDGYRLAVADWGERSVWADRSRNKGMAWCTGECHDDYNSRETVRPWHWQPLPSPPPDAKS